MGTSAKTAHVVGEFNNWSAFSTPMKKLKSGAFTTTLELEPGREYQFRYLLDKKTWENETDADKSVSTPYGDSENSVIII
jgi:1,4-alpha-glucan branching enzyme